MGGAMRPWKHLSALSTAELAVVPKGRPVSLSEVNQILSSESVHVQREVLEVTCRLTAVQTQKNGEDQELYYMACQEIKHDVGLPCNRKVGPGNICPTCDKAVNPEPRLRLRCQFADLEDSIWVTTFHEASLQLLGLTGMDLDRMDRNRTEQTIQAIQYQQVFKLCLLLKPEIYQGQSRASLTCAHAQRVSIQNHSVGMLKEIDSLLSEE